MARLRITETGPGFWHFPSSYGDEYFAQLTAEKRATRYEKGVRKVVWVKSRARNEALDCAVYNQAALDLLNANLDRLAAQIESVEAKDGAEGETPAADEAVDLPVDEKETPERKRRTKRRGTFSGSITGGW
jgi:phage terminase large subunit GpA-like protein